MTEIRRLFCESADATATLYQHASMEERFDGPSVLAEFSVRGLAGHLLRAITTVETYLDAPGPADTADVVSAARYYATALTPGPADLDSDLNRSVRQRGLESAPGPAGELAANWVSTTGRLRDRLAEEPEGRLVQVFGGLVLRLDEYLVTRIVELAVHGDDLALSLGTEPPALPPAATGLAIAALVEVARIRHGDHAVVRALARRERDAVEALRVI